MQQSCAAELLANEKRGNIVQTNDGVDFLLTNDGQLGIFLKEILTIYLRCPLEIGKHRVSVHR